MTRAGQWIRAGVGVKGGERGNTQHIVVLVLLALDLGAATKEIVIYRGSEIHMQKNSKIRPIM